MRPYANHAPYREVDTSIAAAIAINPKLGAWQARVLLALYEAPASDEALELRLGCERTRTSRPRRCELTIAGYVRDSGARVPGMGETPVIVWELTDKGVAKALELTPACEDCVHAECARKRLLARIALRNKNPASAAHEPRAGGQSNDAPGAAG